MDRETGAQLAGTLLVNWAKSVVPTTQNVAARLKNPSFVHESNPELES